MAKYAKNRSRENNPEDNTSVVNINIHYNADTTCFTRTFLYDMCNTSLGSDIQIIYSK
jgi:hypothetical protein